MEMYSLTIPEAGDPGDGVHRVVFPEASLRGSQMAAFSCVFTRAPFLCIHVSPVSWYVYFFFFFLIRPSVRFGLGPHP